MGFIGIVRIAVAYKLVSIIGTELHRYIKHKIFSKQIKNNSMNRWEYYLEHKLLKTYAKYLESFGEVKLIPDFEISGPVANVPSVCSIKVYNANNKHVATIECKNKPVIKKSFNNHYIDIEIVKFKVTSKDDKIEKRSRNIVAQSNKSDNCTIKEDPSIIQRIGNIIKYSKR